MTLVGGRDTFAIEIGPPAVDSDGGSATIDIWIDGRSVCCDDNTAFVPSFRQRLRTDLDRLQRRAIPALPVGQRTAVEAHRWCRADTTGAAEMYWFMQWGETTDNLITHAFCVNDLVLITSQFWRERMSDDDRQDVLVAELSQRDLEDVLQTAIDVLGEGDG